jgi:hypothetical protein
MLGLRLRLTAAYKGFAFFPASLPHYQKNWERAGDVVTTWDGKPATNGGDIIAAGEKRIDEQLMKLIGKSHGK